MKKQIKTTAVAVLFFMVAGIFSAKAQLLYRDSHLFVGQLPSNYTTVASASSPGVYIGPNQGIEYWDAGLNFWRLNQGTSGNYKLFIGDNGNVGIGRKPSTYKLEVSGQVWTSAGLLITSDETKKKKYQEHERTTLCLCKQTKAIEWKYVRKTGRVRKR